MKPFVRRYDSTMYGSALYVVFACDIKSGCAVLPPFLGRLHKKENDGAAGSTLYPKEDNSFAIVFAVSGDGEVSERDIGHEIFHAVDCITDYLGITIKRNDANEAAAYLSGWVCSSIHSAYAKYRKQTQQKET